MGMPGDWGRWKQPSRLGTAVLVALMGTFTLAVYPAVAQEDVLPDEEVEVAAPAQPAGDVAPPPTGSPPQQNYLAWLYGALGPLYSIIFLGLSFALVAVFVMNVLTARRDNILPGQLIDGFEAHLNAKQYQQAYELAKTDESMLGKVLSAGLARVASGYPQAIEAMQEVGEEENMRLEHRLSYLALIGTVCPMFGLLGTVHGMVQAFEVIATSTVTPKPYELAGGISRALTTTLIGLSLAIPAVAAFSILRNRIARLVLEVGIVGENLMSRFQNVGGTKNT